MDDLGTEYMTFQVRSTAMSPRIISSRRSVAAQWREPATEPERNRVARHI
jgi:hypothetical protein